MWDVVRCVCITKRRLGYISDIIISGNLKRVISIHRRFRRSTWLFRILLNDDVVQHENTRNFARGKQHFHPYKMKTSISLCLNSTRSIPKFTKIFRHRTEHTLPQFNLSMWEVLQHYNTEIKIIFFNQLANRAIKTIRRLTLRRWFDELLSNRFAVLFL